MKLLWSDRSQRDLREAARFIAEDNPTAAKRWLRRIKERARQPLKHPYMARKVPEYDDESLRDLVEGNYRILYRVGEGEIRIMAVLESHRQLPDDPQALEQ